MKDVMLTVGKYILPKKLMHFYRHNLELKPYWQEFSTGFVLDSTQRSAAVPAVTTWVPSTLVASDYAAGQLRVLKNYGELLPVSTPQGRYWVFNCRTTVSANAGQSRRITNGRHVLAVEHVVFNTSELARNAVFKTDFDGFRNLYCGESFKRDVERFGLHGLQFSEIVSYGV